MLNRTTIVVLILIAVIGIGAYALTGSKPQDAASPQPSAQAKGASEEGEEEEYERGSHNGRMLRTDDFALEITMFENGTEPEFRVYATMDKKPIDPASVQLTVTLKRLDGETTRFSFVPQEGLLKSESSVEEPHSFDVSVEAVHNGKMYKWDYASYEGRVTIPAETAAASGVKSEEAGPGKIQETMKLTGRIMLNPNRTANVRARFPGVIKSVHKQLGDTINAGDVLATVESNDSLQVYPVKSPIAGVMLTRNANVGEVAGEAAMFTVADLTDVWAEFHIFLRDLQQVKTGQKVNIRTLEGTHDVTGTIISLLPVTEEASQAAIARVLLNNADGFWRAGVTVRGDIILSEKEVPLAVKLSALQRYRDFTVVFEQVGDAYEVRMLKLGAKDTERAEVLEGIKAGAKYVTENSFLIRADIEKSGAAHDH